MNQSNFSQSPNNPNNAYQDIINLPRPIIRNHPPMSRALRAAQFAPYAALVGHKDLIHRVESESTYAGTEIIPEYQDEFLDEDPK